MAAETFGSVWRRVALEAAAVDPLLCRQYVLDAYKRACTGRRWGFLRAETRLTTLASRSVTVGVTNGSTAITSAAAFLSTDDGRQFRVGNGLPYTLTFVSTSACTLDAAYTGTTAAAASGTILDAFPLLPADFDSFRTLTNPTILRPMPWWITRDQLDYVDPNRLFSDATARLVASNNVNSSGRVRYEWYPYPTSAAAYPCTYYRRPDTLTDDEELKGALATRGYVLVLGAQAQVARYPGTLERKNPAFNLQLARELAEDFERELQNLSVVDDDQFLQSIETVDWRWVNQGIPYDGNLLRATDASAYGYGGYGGGQYSY